VRCAALVVDLLERCPAVRVLVTSRQPLRVGGEVLYPVPTLSLPRRGEPFVGGMAARFDAVELFIERAAALNPSFSLLDVDEQAVVALCQRLDGLPLAIELAAAGSRFVPINSLVSSAAPSAHRGEGRFVLLSPLAVVRDGDETRWCPSRSTPVAPVVPVSLKVSMAAEGFHGNRGLVP
jgi:hypothetical protein